MTTAWPTATVRLVPCDESRVGWSAPPARIGQFPPSRMEECTAHFSEKNVFAAGLQRRRQFAERVGGASAGLLDAGGFTFSTAERRCARQVAAPCRRGGLHPPVARSTRSATWWITFRKYKAKVKKKLLNADAMTKGSSVPGALGS